MPTNTICPVPWNNLSLKNNGTFRLCCHANVSESKGTLIGESGRSLTANSSNIEEVRNAPLLRGVRQKMLAGSWHKACVRCQREEFSGLKSRRIYEWDRIKDKEQLLKSINKTSPSGKVPKGSIFIQNLDLRFGNKCNLKCRMCGPSDSSLWYQDHKKLTGEDFSEDNLQGIKIKKASSNNDHYSWYNQDYFWDQIKSQLPHVKYIYLVGGEPLIIKKHYDFLNDLSKHGFARNIELEYNTNLTYLPDRLFPLWENFKKVNVGLSLDGYQGVNDYIRYPSSFKVIEKNIEKIERRCLANVHMWISTTVQVLNIFELEPILKWLLEKNFSFLKKRPGSLLLKTHVLHEPQHYNIQNLPEKAKLKALDNIKNIELLLNNREYRLKYGEVSISNTIKQFNGISDFLKVARKQSNVDFKKFIEVTRSLDIMRNQRVESSVPKLWEQLKPYFNNHPGRK